MAYKKKAEIEKEFVAEILADGGVDTYGNSYGDGNRHLYWFFNLKNGKRRYWTNLSEESQKILGIGE